jgi:hypothetical protein
MRARHRHLKPKSINAFIALDSRYIQQSDNTAISQWDDISGSSNNATQGTAANRPTYQTNELGGNGVVRFDGTNDFLESPTITKNQPYTTFLITYGRTYKFGGFNEAFQDASLGAYVAIAVEGGGSKHSMFAGSQIYGAAASLNTWFLGAYVFNTTSSKLAINGGAVTTGDAGANNINGKFQVGRNWQGLNYYDNDTALAMTCSGAFSDSLRKRVEHAAAYSFKISCN